ncbi:helix-turn-helix domain-containing protein [Haladaptatus sp. F3-133]|uniref:Helix-turn-helix domain-containing protein n=1 Tax=Halorutilus salinus TaxID=2487751 RepID=A0A9Q4C794_9EURY|nr:helix-turn-helix domain-containing protein [Halorutilus salinus]MCX2819714.1 helix-turn-helix domain-containing protein [Halorutilus salinus]
MPEAKISANVPESMWVHDVSKSHPDTVFRVVSALPGDDHGVGVVEIEGEGYEDALDDISEHEAIHDSEVLYEQDENRTALVQLKSQKHLILQKASQSGVPMEMPFEIQDGVGEWRLRASHESLSELGSAFDSMGMEYTIEYVRDVEEDACLLTEKQREVVGKAHELGYYDTPREISLSEVANEMDIAKSTCSEILHRAEGKVVSEFLEG